MNSKLTGTPMGSRREHRRLITHANCPDGIASAMLIRAALPSIEVVFCVYNSAHHKNLEPRIGDLFCDFTPHPDTVRDFVAAGAVVLDHHIGAKGIVEQFGDHGVYSDAKGVSGAMLAYKHVLFPAFERFDVPEVDRELLNAFDFASLVGIRDTWVRDSPEWDLACATSAALMFYGFDGLLEQSALESEQLAVGERIHAQNIRKAENAARGAYPFLDMLLVNDISSTSDVADVFERNIVDGLPTRAGANMVVGFEYRIDPDTRYLELAVSLRSLGDFDVLSVARHNGGGGHAKAAGFAVPAATAMYQDPLSILRLATGRSSRTSPRIDGGEK